MTAPTRGAERNDWRPTLYISAVATAAAIILGFSLHGVASAEHGSKILAWAGLSLLTMAAGHFSLTLPLHNC